MENKRDHLTNKQKDRSFRNKVGEVLEKVGHKISDIGATKIGQKIHDVGDRMEETHDNKNHPHKV